LDIGKRLAKAWKDVHVATYGYKEGKDRGNDDKNLKPERDTSKTVVVGVVMIESGTSNGEGPSIGGRGFVEGNGPIQSTHCDRTEPSRYATAEQVERANRVTQMRKIRFWREKKENPIPKMDKVWEYRKINVRGQKERSCCIHYYDIVGHRT